MLNKDEPNAEWMKELIEAQQQYWDNFSTLMQSLANASPTVVKKEDETGRQAHSHHPFHQHVDSWPKLSQHCQHLASMAALYPKSAFHPAAPKTPSYAEAQTFGVFEHFNSLPAIGPSRENIEMLQQSQPLLADFMQALADYQPILGGLWLAAWKRTLAKVGEAMQQQKPLTTHQIYDIWIECGEQTYAEVVATENYQKIYGKFANAALACKNHQQNILQEILRSMNLPTKQDLNSAYERIHMLTRELRENKKDIAALKEQLQTLIASQFKSSKQSVKSKSTIVPKSVKE